MTGMAVAQANSSPASEKRLSVGLARSESEVKEAQRLRYKVFGEELGASLPSLEVGLDRDLYDPYCDHLLVRDGETNAVVGTYRILAPTQAGLIGRHYSEAEFDLRRLAHLTPRLVEVGRSCVHPDYRNGTVISLLWMGLCDYMLARRYEYLIGCASISTSDGGWAAANLYLKLKAKHLSPEKWRVFPKRRLSLHPVLPYNNGGDSPPPLVKGYLRLGAYICGDPAWDPNFNTADLLMLLPISRMNPRYARHFIRK